MVSRGYIGLGGSLMQSGQMIVLFSSKITPASKAHGKWYIEAQRFVRHCSDAPPLPHTRHFCFFAFWKMSPKLTIPPISRTYTSVDHNAQLICTQYTSSAGISRPVTIRSPFWRQRQHSRTSRLLIRVSSSTLNTSSMFTSATASCITVGVIFGV